MRAMTIDGLCIFLDITRQTFDNYCGREGFFDIMTRIQSVIRSQKFAGAAADLLNPNIIARDLGLIDRQEVKSTGESPVGKIQIEIISANPANQGD